jgi:hypothetical protein
MAQEDGKTGRFDDGSDQIIAACIEVHRHLGPGLLKAAYEQCVAYELSLRGFRSSDILVEDKFIVEVKAARRLLPIHQAQVLTYLKLTGLPVALFVNFNVAVLKYGLRRLTRKPDPTFPSSCSLTDSHPSRERSLDG